MDFEIDFSINRVFGNIRLDTINFSLLYLKKIFLRALLPTDAEAPKLDKDKKKEAEERGGEKAEKKKEKHGKHGSVKHTVFSFRMCVF